MYSQYRFFMSINNINNSIFQLELPFLAYHVRVPFRVPGHTRAVLSFAYPFSFCSEDYTCFSFLLWIVTSHFSFLLLACMWQPVFYVPLSNGLRRTGLCIAYSIICRCCLHDMWQSDKKSYKKGTSIYSLCSITHQDDGIIALNAYISLSRLDIAKRWKKVAFLYV